MCLFSALGVAVCVRAAHLDCALAWAVGHVACSMHEHINIVDIINLIDF